MYKSIYCHRIITSTFVLIQPLIWCSKFLIKKTKNVPFSALSVTARVKLRAMLNRVEFQSDPTARSQTLRCPGQKGIVKILSDPNSGESSSALSWIKGDNRITARPYSGESSSALSWAAGENLMPIKSRTARMTHITVCSNCDLTDNTIRICWP